MFWDGARNPLYTTKCGIKELRMKNKTDTYIRFRGYTGEETGYKTFEATLTECGEHPGNATCQATKKRWKQKEYPYGLLATDYTSYDVYYFCYPFAYGYLRGEVLMVSTRDGKMPTGDKLETIKKVIKDNVPWYDLDTYKGYVYLQEDWCKNEWKWNEYPNL